MYHHRNMGIMTERENHKAVKSVAKIAIFGEYFQLYQSMAADSINYFHLCVYFIMSSKNIKIMLKEIVWIHWVEIQACTFINVLSYFDTCHRLEATAINAN